MTPKRGSVDPDVLEVHVVPSEEVRMVPVSLSPTATYNGLVMAVDLPAIDCGVFNSQPVKPQQLLVLHQLKSSEDCDV